ncbi:hypothetical protein DFH08DRAFT_808778 [Mycena albidolilacea]|uniref:Uncharacterized protein n=1 Tax=Mycena albidolilacea TaxID=1033008 RepID=A0AAD7A328_9AGAR|nr:hypothetical protein DFH08DRAFT_808778 [Mycena albidolilacea]
MYTLSTNILDGLGAIYGIVKKVVEALREAMILETCGLAGMQVEALSKVLRARGFAGKHLEEPCEDLRSKERSETPKPRDGGRQTASWQERYWPNVEGTSAEHTPKVLWQTFAQPFLKAVWMFGQIFDKYRQAEV